MPLDEFSSREDQWTGKPWFQHFLIALAAVFVVPAIIAIIHRVYIHPLRHIPGPLLAAVTDFYGFYHNFKGGGYSKLFRDLHKKHASPVIRIGPNHVHVDSPELFEEIFRIGSNYAKDPSFYKNFGGLDAMLDAEDFRTYRTHISSLYSARSADRLAPRLLTELQAIEKRLEQNANIVLRLLFPQDVNLFETEGYHPFLEAFDMIMTKTWLKWANDAQLLRAKQRELERDSHMTRYLDIDPNDHKKVKAVPHPLEDIFNFIAGGSDTTAYTASCAVHYLLSSPEILAKLQAELDQSSLIIRGDFDHKRIQNLPYLNAVVKETLRLSNPVPGCLPRIVPSGGIHVKSVYIPAGTAVSVTLLCIQQNEKLFPEPQKFRPERWLGEEGKLVEKWNIAFSRGPRQCIGTK
ncbi:putative elymoclavine monooxygenase [Annulohypoxylon truncatum]|uniref:putative elymoclavine monooxygenase n=1 Tax=Annulohypoxylon truncatum TaxID=327061 RepID=UPI00200895AF|nr:putative elymoclavine monooxygenase [Annulohypoxylon truncatum]KAI1214327.1 putative elymoclavine monooxygenase [Annulohypoxylon truncatum]